MFYEPPKPKKPTKPVHIDPVEILCVFSCFIAFAISVFILTFTIIKFSTLLLFLPFSFYSFVLLLVVIFGFIVIRKGFSRFILLYVRLRILFFLLILLEIAYILFLYPNNLTEILFLIIFLSLAIIENTFSIYVFFKLWKNNAEETMKLNPSTSSSGSAYRNLYSSGVAHKQQPVEQGCDGVVIEKGEEVELPSVAIARTFNRKPNLGVQAFLLENNLSENDPAHYDSFALFLHTCTELNFEKIGDFISLGENTRYLKAFFDFFDFSNDTFDVALRKCLLAFNLPGEGQKIDRIVLAFAVRYSQEHPETFDNPDVGYLLAFSLIMLNTDIHNPAIRQNITKDTWILNNLSIDIMKDLPVKFLESLYNSISQNEIKLNSPVFSRALLKGWLKKKGRNNRWQRRFFILSQNCLYYFYYENDAEPHAVIPLENVAVREFKDGKHHGFALYSRTGAKIKSCKMKRTGPELGIHESFILRAQPPEGNDEWIQFLRTQIVENPVLRLCREKIRDQSPLQKRKKSLKNSKIIHPENIIIIPPDQDIDEEEKVIEEGDIL